MAKIVLIHGIAQEVRSADEIEAEWLPALAGGIRLAGSSTLADAIGKGKIPVKAAFYGHRFRTEAQGQDSLSSLASNITAERLAFEWLQRSALTESDDVRAAARRELSLLSKPVDQRQGLGNVVRSAIASLAQVPLLAELGLLTAESFLMSALGQVTTYFDDTQVRDLIQKDVAAAIDSETEIVIGHSLGSIIAFEMAHKLGRQIRLLLTLGSPIGLRNIVFEKLTPAPPCFPPLVQTWHNIADKEDFIAAATDLKPLFLSSIGRRKFDNTLINNGARPHKVQPYLTSSSTGRAIVEALLGGQAAAT